MKKIPEGWGFKKLKHIIRKKITDGPHESPEFIDDGVPFLSVDSIQDGKLIFENCRFISKDAHIRYKKKCHPEKDDILMGKAASIGKIAIVDVDFDFSVWSPLALLKPNKNMVEPKFMEYTLKSDYSQDQINIFSTLNTQQNISMDDIKNLSIVLPSKPEQCSIIKLLNQKTTKIDELIKKNETLIELLKEKRQAIISHAVTKGLDQNAKMKDSGVEWLGKVPEGWEVRRLRYISKSVKTGATPPSENLEYYDEGNIDWYTPGDFGERLELMSSSKKITALAIKNRVARIFEKGTILLVGIGATLGKIALMHKQASLNQQINAIVLEERFIPKFYAYYLNSVKDIIISLSNAATLGIINQERTKQIICLVPPKEEQIAIANYLDQKTARIDETIQKIQSQNEKLKEYRQALISNVVTGKVRVDEN
ncbi:MAG: restriction endonuclease subunit S [Thermodesulfovibrionia bacterium]|nr:restriction endonuclease subunit S [Thermodesulfovibrionia bacterium]